MESPHRAIAADRAEAGPLTSGEVTRRRIETVVFAPMSDALRNHLVTLAYVDLSTAMADLLGHDDANWCSLAVWPSYTVGTTIRSSSSGRFLQSLARLPLPKTVARRLVERIRTDRPDRKGVMNRSLAAGNRGVFYEIGLAWTDFLETFGSGERTDADWQAFDRFRARVLALPLPPGKVWPDGDREKLVGGFGAYLEALRSSDARRRSQLIFLGNMLIGDHEQRRLQGWLDLSTLAPIRRMAGLFDDEASRNRGVALTERLWAAWLTKRVFYVEMAGERIRVGRVVPPADGIGPSSFPPPLDELDPDVAEVFERIEAAASGGDGAERWTDIDNRMAFIVHLFRSRQRVPRVLATNPYPPDERAAILELARTIEVGVRRPPDRVGDGPDEQLQDLLFADLTSELDAPWTAAVDRAFRSTLDAARLEGDGEADAAVEAFYAASDRPSDERHYTDALKAIAAPSAHGRGPVARFLATPPALPEWADLELIRAGQTFYSEFRTAAHLGLFFGAMPLSYAASKGCQVLGLVSTLNPNSDTVGRFWESTRFVEDVFTTPFWETDSAGYRSIRGVRLFHASVRSMLEAQSIHVARRPSAADPNASGPVWDDALGRPINQEDLFAATLDWSVATIHVMDRFAVPLTEQQALAYFHTWLVVGALLGVDSKLLMSPADPSRPLDLEEAQYAAKAMLDRQIGWTPAGSRLMDGLIDLIDDWFPKPLRRLPRAMMYAALDDEIAGVLGLSPPGRVERAFVRFTAEARTWRRNSLYRRGATHVLEFVGQRWLHWWEQEYQGVPPYRQGGHESIEERIPLSLKVTIEAFGEIQDLPVTLSGIDGLNVASLEPEAGTRFPGFSQIAELHSDAASSMRAAVRRLRETVNTIAGLQRAEIEVDGKTWAVSALTDQQIDQLFPD